jgi:hypothetical protein
MCIILQVVGLQQYLVKPRVADVNENVLSEQLVTESSLTEDLVKNGVALETAIQQVGLQLLRGNHCWVQSCEYVVSSP